ncbi:hypothetical protein OpiT1DRAFT_01812 [Opitutaceae bacterium TAV1]|nr:hypothetical protein OpiT1DRAFT_01812 [Opitutaceae bacterium TAV1]
MNTEYSPRTLVRTLLCLAVLTTPCLLSAFVLQGPAVATGVGSVEPATGRG